MKSRETSKLYGQALLLKAVSLLPLREHWIIQEMQTKVIVCETLSLGDSFVYCLNSLQVTRSTVA